MTNQALPVSLTFTPNPSGASIRWESEAIGARISHFINPFNYDDTLSLTRVLDWLHYPGQSLLIDDLSRLKALSLIKEISDLPNANFHKLVGRRIYAALIEDMHGLKAMDTLRNIAIASQRHIEISFLFPQNAISLAALPWELMWDEREIPLLFAQGQVVSYARHLDLDEAIPPVSPVRLQPLRVLAVTPLADTDIHNAKERIQKVRNLWDKLRAQGVVEVIELTPASRKDLVDALQASWKPDILHFTGHGRYLDGRGYLIFDRADSKFDPLPVDQLVPLCAGLRMVVLSACQGAMVGGSGLRTGIAPAISASGVPIVLGMQYSVKAEAAHRFSEVLYRSIFKGQSVQDAVRQARQALYVEEQENTSWYVPVLYIRSRERKALFV